MSEPVQPNNVPLFLKKKKSKVVLILDEHAQYQDEPSDQLPVGILFALLLSSIVPP
jgi:hypothetical protein